MPALKYAIQELRANTRPARQPRSLSATERPPHVQRGPFSTNQTTRDRVCHVHGHRHRRQLRRCWLRAHHDGPSASAHHDRGGRARLPVQGRSSSRLSPRQPLDSGQGNATSTAPHRQLPREAVEPHRDDPLHLQLLDAIPQPEITLLPLCRRRSGSECTCHLRRMLALLPGTYRSINITTSDPTSLGVYYFEDTRGSREASSSAAPIDPANILSTGRPCESDSAAPATNPRVNGTGSRSFSAGAST
jgi:hypothetical protein